MQDGVNGLLSELQGKCGETSQVAIRSSDDTGDYLVQPALRNPAVGVATGQRRYRESVAGREFWVASPSFFQVNVKQAARLAELVRDGLGLSGRETVVGRLRRGRDFCGAAGCGRGGNHRHRGGDGGDCRCGGECGRAGECAVFDGEG